MWKLAIILSFVISVKFSFSQISTSNKSICDSLSGLSSTIWKQKNDSAKIAASELFFENLNSVLKRVNSINIPLDSLYGITRAISADNKLRVFTWNVPLDDGSNKYFGLVQISDINNYLIPLRSVLPESEISASDKIDISNWYGALYYKIIIQKAKNRTLYTLLGWDGYNSVSNRKIIDILSFDEMGNLYFGLPLFKTADGIKSRIVFEYAEKANMLLRYDYQAIRIQTKKRIRKENTWMIAMDRLIPADPSLTGIYKYYVPAGDVYDGFIFKDGYWVLAEDVEVVNQ